MAETTTISVKVYKSQLKEIERLAKQRGVDKFDALRQLLSQGLKQERRSEALQLVRESKITVRKAAEIAGVSYRAMLNALKSENVPFPQTAESLKVELGDPVKAIEGILEGAELGKLKSKAASRMLKRKLK